MLPITMIVPFIRAAPSGVRSVHVLCNHHPGKLQWGATASMIMLRGNQMAEILVSAERALDQPANKVYSYIVDYQTHHAAWLPPAYSQYLVTAGGVGTGTEFSYHLNTGRRERDYHMEVTEPIPGRTVQEADTTSSLTNTWTIESRGNGSLVRIETRWQGAGGVGGFFERTFAPRALQALHTDTLARLAEYARDRRGTE